MRVLLESETVSSPGRQCPRPPRFEPESCGINRRPVPDYVRTWIASGNLGFLRRFPIGRFKLYRNVLEPLPVVSDDFSMTCRIQEVGEPWCATAQVPSELETSRVLAPTIFDLRQTGSPLLSRGRFEGLPIWGLP